MIRVLIFLAAVPLWGQVRASGEIRLHTAGESVNSILDGHVELRDISLRRLLQTAWDLPASAVSGPAWMDAVRLDVTADAGRADTPRAGVMAMLQNLITKKMALVARVEEQESDVYVLRRTLVLWGEEKKLQPSAWQPGAGGDGQCVRRRGLQGQQHLECTHVTMTGLAESLPVFASAYVKRAVVNETEIGGFWDFQMDWAWGTFDAAGVMVSDGGLSIFSALKGQLGLVLESQRMVRPVLVVKSVGRVPE